MLCAAARAAKVAAEGSALETVDNDAVHSSYVDWCTLRGLSAVAAAKLIFGVDADPKSKRMRGACERWAGRRELGSAAVQEAAKRVRTRPPSRPRPA